MNELPFLVVHGGWVWMLVVPLFVVAAYGFWWCRRRWRSRMDAGWAHAKLGTPAWQLAGCTEGSELVVAGTLRSEGNCEHFVDASPVAVSTFGWSRRGHEPAASRTRRADRLWIETKDGSVQLPGDVVATVGGQEHRPSLGAGSAATVKRLTSDAGLSRPNPLWRERPVHRSLRDGDPVMVHGSLQRTADSEGSDYRSGAAAFELVPSGDDTTLRLVFAAAPAVRRPARGQIAGIVLTGGLAFLLCSYVLGRCGISKADADGYELVDSTRPFEIPEVSWLSLAAATPFHRDEALDEIEDELQWTDVADRDRMEALVALARLQEDCNGAARHLHDHQQHRAALRQLGQCDPPDYRIMASAHATLGEMKLASDAAATLHRVDYDAYPLSEQLAYHLMAHEWERAASHARRIAKQRDGDRALTWRCLALAFEAKAGDPDALDRLRSEERPGARAACAILATELTGAPEDIDRLAQPDIQASLADHGHEFELAAARDHLLLQHRGRPGRFISLHATRRPTVIVAGDWTDDAFSQLGLLLRGKERVSQLPDTKRGVAITWWNTLAAATAHVGDVEAATGYLERAEAVAPPGSGWLVHRGAASVWLRLGDSDRAAHHAAQLAVDDVAPALVALARGDAEPLIEIRLSGHDIYRELAEAVRAAVRTGDGAHLRGVLGQSNDHRAWLFAPLLARNIERNPEPLLEFAELAGTSRSDTPPSARFLRTGLRLMIADALGDEELASEYRKRLHTRYDILADPELALFLYLTQELL